MTHKPTSAKVRDDRDGYYGISIRDREGHETHYDSITKDREALERLAIKINRGDVSDLHIYDIIEDIIG